MNNNPLLILLFLLTSVSVAYAQPEYVNYQGYLKDSEGNPLSTGPYTMEFNLYSDPTDDGSMIWGPYQYDDGAGDGHAKQVIVTNGRFNVILGPKDSAGRYLSDAFVSNDAYVQIQVGDDDPIQPRQQILSTPFAFEATNAGKLNNVAPVNYFNPSGMIAPFAGSSDKIPTGWLICDGSELVSTDYPELYAVIGKTWGGRQESAGEVTIDYFNLPDLRGMFLRGANLDRSDTFADEGPRTDLDPSGDEMPEDLVDAATTQSDTIKLHRHAWAIGFDSQDLHTWHVNGTEYKILEYVGALQINSGNDVEDNYLDVRLSNNDRVYTAPDSTIDSAESFTPGETRPRNAAVNYIIKL